MRENLKRRLDTIQKNIWLTFLGVVAALAIALSVFYFFKMRDMRLKRVANDDVYKQQLENHYQMSLFRLCDSTKNADANLSKLAVSNSPAVQQELLLKIQSEADTALSDISALPLESELSGKASRFFNQLSDYCSVTAKEISSGKALTDAHRESFKNLKSVSGGLLAKLESITTQNTDKLLINALEGEGDNYLNDGLGEMEDNAFDYPQLIYDGPFSESVTNKKLETSEKWTTERMTGKLREIFSDYEIESIEYVGSVKSKADAELFEMTAKDGRVYSAELTKDGRLLSLDSYNAEVPEKAEKLSCDDCSAKAEEMAKKLGFDVNANWVSKPLDDNTIYVNLVAKQGSFVLYPDHVKMVVDVYTGRVVGVEAFAYLVNHTTRQLPEVDGLGAAVDRLGDDFEVTDTNFAVIPVGNDEKTCYEFRGMCNGEEFFVYIDMETKEEVEILKILKDKEGYTVL